MFDAIVLAGGRATRLGGVDKPALDVGAVTLLDRAVAAVAGAGRVVVVGPRRPVAGEVVWCREEPAGGGPAAAIAAGLEHTGAEVVVVLAADLPWVAPAVPRLLAAVGTEPAGDLGVDVAVLVDAEGRRSYLAAAWRRSALTRAVTAMGDTSGAAARRLFEGADIIEVRDPAGWGEDCDTWDDVDRARRRSGREGTPR